MRIYVGTYAKYNSGNLNGAWLDVEDYSDKDEFYEACKELHKDESDPEFMFQDHEGIPSSLIGESWVSETVFELAGLSEQEQTMYSLYLDNVDGTADLDAARDSFQGVYRSTEDFAEELTEECYDLNKVPAFIRNHIDWEGVARDMRGDYSFVEHEGDVWVFRNY